MQVCGQQTSRLAGIPQASAPTAAQGGDGFERLLAGIMRLRAGASFLQVLLQEADGILDHGQIKRGRDGPVIEQGVLRIEIRNTIHVRIVSKFILK